MTSIYSGKPLSEVPYEDIFEGMELISAIQVPGKVIEKHSPGHRGEDNDIDIQWDNGKTSSGWHFQLDKVKVK